MNPVRRKKLIWVLATLAGAIVAVVLVIYAIGQQTDFYFDPTAIAAGEAPQDKRIRAGGMVVAGSVKRDPSNEVNVQFEITDFNATVPVTYQGILPDLFAENSGVVATGKMQGDTFVASEVLAKHDENYMPPEVAASLKQDHVARGVSPDAEQFSPAIPVAQNDEQGNRATTTLE
ncbi:cytochrome c maturation protein CcmE [Psychrobacter sp. I-STPA6b]|uniref:cytochrome c maturation protein CcmE n=1 Tax=Psychrobacter sp. I-STPA6b TaxID=2585718 RepID=UPI001D0CC070|nr:cytochrome c maturation protein CcmE [Psychrobacter sp. I-STPA6b]